MKCERARFSISTQPIGLLRRVIRFAACAALLTSCNRDNHTAPAPVDIVDPRPRMDASVTDPCVSPGHLGCPCDEKSASVECGKVIERTGDYVTCSMGRSTCDGQAWGP